MYLGVTGAYSDTSIDGVLDVSGCSGTVVGWSRGPREGDLSEEGS